MNINTPALLFPAISLLLLAYTQRFLSVASIIRTLHSKLGDTENEKIILQIENLHTRINLIKAMQASGVSSILFCVISMLGLFTQQEFIGKAAFTISMVLMLISLVVSLWEILLSGNALKIELEDIRKSRNC